MSKKKTFADIRPGDRVVMLAPNGKRLNRETRQIEQEWTERTGRVVMKGPAGWVLNLGGAHGTPGICGEANFVRFA